MKAKIIGGPADGKTIEWDSNYIQLPGAEPAPFRRLASSDGDVVSEPVEFKTQLYKKSKIMGETEVFTVLVPDHWTGDDLIRELIKRA